MQFSLSYIFSYSFFFYLQQNNGNSQAEEFIQNIKDYKDRIEYFLNLFEESKHNIKGSKFPENDKKDFISNHIVNEKKAIVYSNVLDSFLKKDLPNFFKSVHENNYSEMEWIKNHFYFSTRQWYFEFMIKKYSNLHVTNKNIKKIQFYLKKIHARLLHFQLKFLVKIEIINLNEVKIKTNEKFEDFESELVKKIDEIEFTEDNNSGENELSKILDEIESEKKKGLKLGNSNRANNKVSDKSKNEQIFTVKNIILLTLVVLLI